MTAAFANRLAVTPTARRPRATWLLLVFLILVFLGAQQDLSYAHRTVDTYNVDAGEIISSVSGGSFVRQLSLLSLGAVAVFLLIRQRRTGVWRMQSIAALLPVSFALWVLASPLWADDRSLTLTRTFIFFLLCLGSAAVARRFGLRDLPRLTLVACTTYVLLGLLAELAFGTLKPWRVGYRFAGLLHPNGQGLQCGLLLVACVASAWTVRRRFKLFLCAIPAVFLLLVLTQSRTALGVTLFALILFVALVTKPRTRLNLLIAAAFCGAALLAFVGSNSLKEASRLGRVEDTGSDQSFNGRTDIWLDLGSYIRERPLTGYGYGGFWTPNRISDMSDREGWGVAAGHSAYIDTALCLGLPGLALYIGALLSSAAVALRRFLRTRNPDYAFCLAVLLLFILDGVLDSINLGVSLLVFLCMVIIARLHFTPEEKNASLSVAHRLPLDRRRIGWSMPRASAKLPLNS